MTSPRAPRTRTRLTALALVAALALAACGSSNKAPDANQDADGGSESTSSDGGGVTVTDVTGEVTLPATATKVVALEWTYVEDLLAVGVDPVGVADVTNYRDYVKAEPALADDVEDVGTRQEPSIERIRRLKPDLIIAGEGRLGGNEAELRKIAPVLEYNPYPDASTDQWAEMTDTFTQIATAVGKADEAEQVLADLDERIAGSKAAFAEADLATDRIVLAQGEGTPDAPKFRLFTSNAMVVQLAEELGLENAWDGTPEAYGFNSVTLEGLTAIEGDAWFLPVAPSAALEEFDELFGDSPLWRSLDIVKNDRVRPLSPGAWFFGGPLSADYLIGELETALIE